MASIPSPALTLAMAEKLLDVAVAHAAGIGVPMSICVLDEAGHQVAARRMDGARWITVDIAAAKAATAAAWHMPGRDVGERLSAAPALLTSIIVQQQGAFAAAEGGYPIVIDDVILGGMGASGGTGAQDGEVVRAALEALVGSGTAAEASG